MEAQSTRTRVVAPIMEVFASIQGEGAFVGEPQTFVRLRGCPLRCRWCDTPRSWTIAPDDRARVARRAVAPADAFDTRDTFDAFDTSDVLDTSTARDSNNARDSTDSRAKSDARDAAASRELVPSAREHVTPTARDRTSDDRRDPWATPFQVACWIREVEPGAPRTVSVTGGEPLLWPEFLLGLKSMLGTRRLHLETAGAHPETLARVIDAFDHVSLDLKPERDLDPPEELAATALAEGASISSERSPRSSTEWREARRACLALVRDRDACAKIVVSGARDADELARLLDEVAETAPLVPVYLQPATPMNGVPAPSSATLESLVEMARDRGLFVRVLPQVHRALRVR
jgi:organic radical activating enzyme